MMTGVNIIKKFEVWTDDQTELSTDEEYFLANQKAKEIYNEATWEFLRKNATGSFTGGEIDLPADFKYAMANYTDDPTYGTPTVPVVYVAGVPYKIIPMGMRQQHQGGQVCWVDIVNSKIKFSQNVGGAYDFDYQYEPEDFTADTSPAIPSGHEFIIVYAMLIDDDIIQKVEKARSNIKENSSKFQQLLSNLKSHNAKFMLQQ